MTRDEKDKKRKRMKIVRGKVVGEEERRKKGGKMTVRQKNKERKR